MVTINQMEKQIIELEHQLDIVETEEEKQQIEAQIADIYHEIENKEYD